MKIDKNVKGTKTFTMKWKLKFKDFKNCLEIIQLENEINYHYKKYICLATDTIFASDNPFLLET